MSAVLNAACITHNVYSLDSFPETMAFCGGAGRWDLTNQSKPMTDFARHTWLYVRGDMAVHIARMDMTLTVYGPGPTEHVHLFRESDSLEGFLLWYGEALVRDGWALQAYVDRRASPPDESRPPGGVERRRGSRDDTP